MTKIDLKSYMYKPIRVSNIINVVIRKVNLNFCELVAEGSLGTTLLRLPFGVKVSFLDSFYYKIDLGYLYPLILEAGCNQHEDDSWFYSLRRIFVKLVYNQIRGVIGGYQQVLLLKGMGFKAKVNSGLLSIKLGWSHLVIFPIPYGIFLHITKPKCQKIAIRTVCKYLLGSVVNTICNLKYPNPYTGKGILVKKRKFPRKSGKQTKLK
jgi:ribosomal protein L6P/L9E